jgi:hypothetical protein
VPTVVPVFRELKGILNSTKPVLSNNLKFRKLLEYGLDIAWGSFLEGKLVLNFNTGQVFLGVVRCRLRATHL